MKTINIFTDGSSRSNGKPTCTGGWSMVIPDFNGKKFVRYGFLDKPSSNNKAEIMGILIAVHIFHNQDKFSLQIKSDSQYVVKSCNEWRHGWVNPDGSYKERMKNKELLIPLFGMLDKRVCPIDISWVKGHAGDPGNEMADLYAGFGNDKIDRSIRTDNMDVQFIDQEELVRRYGYDPRYDN